MPSPALPAYPTVPRSRRECEVRGIAPCILWSALFSAGTNLLVLAVPLYMMQLYDRVLSTGSIDTLLLLTAIVVAALATFAVLDAARAVIMVRLGSWVESSLGAGVLAVAVERQARAGDASAQGLRDLATVRSALASPALLALFDVLWVPVYLGVVFLVHPVLGWIGVGGAALLAAAALANDWSTRGGASAASDRATRALAGAEAAVRSADAAQAMGMGSALAQRWEVLAGDARATQGRAARRSAVITATAKALRLGLQVAVLGTGATLVLAQELTGGGMIAAAIILSRGLAPLEQLIGSWRLLTAARRAWRRLREARREAPDDGGTRLPRPTGRLEVEGLAFAAPGARQPILRKVTLQIATGEVVGVVGPSGAGKTTLMRLLAGSLRPSAGHVRLDGADLHAWTEADRGRYVGYLPQAVELLPGTVRENIARMGEAEDEAVVRAAMLAGAHEAVLLLQDGYATRIGPGGVPLSGGQRQRIGLARAVFGDVRLLVLDEPNAHLDAEGEVALIETVSRMSARGTTVVMVSQRMNVMVHADKLVVVKDGTVATVGARDTMLRRLGHPVPPPARKRLAKQ